MAPKILSLWPTNDTGSSQQVFIEQMKWLSVVMETEGSCESSWKTTFRLCPRLVYFSPQIISLRLFLILSWYYIICASVSKVVCWHWGWYLLSLFVLTICRPGHDSLVLSVVLYCYNVRILFSLTRATCPALFILDFISLPVIWGTVRKPTDYESAPKGSDDGTLNSVLLFLWTWSIV
jgi:hypothetical protein